LREVFGDELQDNARPIVVSLKGNPTTVPGHAWSGRAWKVGPERGPSLPVQANNYFSLAAFRPQHDGTYRRQKALFHSLYAVMLDDVGTKVPQERLTLPPRG